MYLIFSGIAEICKLPGKACLACGDLCKQLNCGICKDGCRAMAKGCSGFVEKPLSSFVVITCLMSIVELGYLASTFGIETLKACEFPESAYTDVTGWIVIQMAFALLNLCFAPYFQYKVWQRLWEESDAATKLQTQKELQVEKEVVQSSFKDVFMKDFGVCFYFFALIVSFLWSKWGFDWVTSDPATCNPDGGLSLAAWVGWLFFFVAVLYTICWYCCSCCAKATTIRGGYEYEDEEIAKPLQ